MWGKPQRNGIIYLGGGGTKLGEMVKKWSGEKVLLVKLKNLYIQRA